MKNGKYEIIKTGIHLTGDELDEIKVCNFDPTASMHGPKKINYLR